MELEEANLEDEGYQTKFSIDHYVALNVNQFLLIFKEDLLHKIVYRNLAIDFMKSMLLDLEELEFNRQDQKVDISIISYQFIRLLV